MSSKTVINCILVSQTTVMATKNSIATNIKFKERKPPPESSDISVVSVISVVAPEPSDISVISVVTDVTDAGLHGMPMDALHLAKYAVIGAPVYKLLMQHPSLFPRSRNNWWQNALHVELKTQFENM